MIAIYQGTPLAAISQSWLVRLIQAGKSADQPYKDTTWTTAIYKQPLSGPVEVDRYGIAGDEHPGAGIDLDRAVCFHPLAHDRRATFAERAWG